MSSDYKNEKYNLLWKNIIIKKEVSGEYADKCIHLFMNDDKKMYLYKQLCNEEDALNDNIGNSNTVNDNIVIGNTVNDNIGNTVNDNIVIGNTVNDNIVIGNTVNNNIVIGNTVIGLNFIKEVLQINGL
jgi:hypothetical protein